MGSRLMERMPPRPNLVVLYEDIREIKMKPKTFTYNQIICFFQDIKLPLTAAQIAAIGEKHREEIKNLDEAKRIGKEKANKRLLKRLKRKQNAKVCDKTPTDQ